MRGEIKQEIHMPHASPEVIDFGDKLPNLAKSFNFMEEISYLEKCLALFPKESTLYSSSHNMMLISDNN